MDREIVKLLGGDEDIQLTRKNKDQSNIITNVIPAILPSWEPEKPLKQLIQQVSTQLEILHNRQSIPCIDSCTDSWFTDLYNKMVIFFMFLSLVTICCAVIENQNSNLKGFSKYCAMNEHEWINLMSHKTALSCKHITNTWSFPVKSLLVSRAVCSGEWGTALCLSETPCEPPLRQARSRAQCSWWHCVGLEVDTTQMSASISAPE